MTPVRSGWPCKVLSMMDYYQSADAVHACKGQDAHQDLCFESLMLGHYHSSQVSFFNARLQVLRSMLQDDISLLVQACQQP